MSEFKWRHFSGEIILQCVKVDLAVFASAMPAGAEYVPLPLKEGEPAVQGSSGD